MIPKRPTQEPNVDSWLMSYADMITLLLCFFIIFVSVSEPKKDKLKEVTEGMATKFGSVDLSTPFQGVLRSLQAVVEERQILKDVAIEKNKSGLDMEISALAFYQADSAEFNKDKLPILAELVRSIKSMNYLDYRITIEGHTSDVPFQNAQYPSNWELSAARAARMARFFVESGVPADHLRIVGYAGTQPKVPNLDAEHHPIPENRAHNQRIIIRLERLL